MLKNHSKVLEHIYIYIYKHYLKRDDKFVVSHRYILRERKLKSYYFLLKILTLQIKTFDVEKFYWDNNFLSLSALNFFSLNLKSSITISIIICPEILSLQNSLNHI